MLGVKEQQFQDAIDAALGVELTAVAKPRGNRRAERSVAAFTPRAAMRPVVPGQTFDVRATFTNRGSIAASVADVSLRSIAGVARRAGGTEGPRPMQLARQPVARCAASPSRS